MMFEIKCKNKPTFSALINANSTKNYPFLLIVFIISRFPIFVEENKKNRAKALFRL